MELDFESLFADCLSSLTEANGGSLSTALWEMGIDDESEQGKAIKKWFGWDDEEDYDEDEEDE